MDSVLNTSNILYFDIEDEDPIIEDVDIWIKRGDFHIPTKNVILEENLPPGMYTVDFNNNDGIYCQRLPIVSDSLYTFKDGIIKSLINEIDSFWEKSNLYKENNLIHKRGILLEGFPGTGKTSIITLLCKKLINSGGVVFKVIDEDNFSLYASFIKNSFRKIQPETPIITIIEDIDRYEREDVLLDFLDGKTSLNHHVVIATSNNTEKLPITFLRPSRLDIRIEVPLPCKEIRKEYFQYKKIENVSLEDLVEQTEGLSLADLKEVYISVNLLGYKLKDVITKLKHPKSKKNYLTINSNNKDFGI